MEYTNFKTFTVKSVNGILTVTFNYPPVNIQGIPMIEDLDKLCDNLNQDKEVKVVIFESAIPNFFIAHADTNMLQNMSTLPVRREEVEIENLARVLDRISKLDQATIAKIEGYARGGGHEFALACDMRFAARNKAIFMQMEVGMGIIPSGGGTVRMARQVGLGKALEIILSAKDFNAEEAERLGTINRAIDDEKIGIYVYELATRIAKFPLEAISAAKKTIYSSIDMPIEEALKEETYQLYQTTSKTPAIKRFKQASATNFQEQIENQKNFDTLLMDMQEIK